MKASRIDLVVFGLAGTVAVLLAFVVVTGPQRSLALMVIAMPFATWIVLRRRFNPVYLSPTLIVAVFFAIIGIFGYALRSFLSSLNGRGTSVSLSLSDDQSFHTLILIMGAATILIATSGTLLSAMPADFKSTQSSEWDSPSPSGILIFLSMIPLVWIAGSAGIGQLINRPSYLFVGAGSLAGSIGSSLGPAMVVFVGYLFAASSGAKRSASVALLIGYSVLLFSMGSRRFALVPVLFGIGMFLAKNSRRIRLSVLVCAAFTAALLPLPLMFRGSTTHGVVPYFQMLTQASPTDADWAGALNNVLVSFPIIGETAFGGSRVQASDLWVSLNPIPGTAAGWYDISQRLRLNAYTPTAGLGELANVGWIPVVFFFIVSGVILAWAERRVRRHLANGSQIFAAIILGLTAFFAFQMVQYNLRSAVRMLIYMLAVEIARNLVLIYFVPGRHQKAGVPIQGRTPEARYEGKRGSVIAGSDASAHRRHRLQNTEMTRYKLNRS